MRSSIYKRVKVLIEKTSDAFSSCGTIDADYAEFASAKALSEFKQILHRPGLTDSELKLLLRTAMHKHKSEDPWRRCWTTFMAQHIARAANKNVPLVFGHATIH